MQIQLARDPLLRALQLVQNIVEPRQTLPILAHVLIEAAEGGVQLTATDLEVSARVTVPATVLRSGGTTLGARKLAELVRELPPEPITLSLRDDGWVDLVCGGATFRLAALPADEFPPFDPGGGAGWLELEAATLRGMLARTSFAMAQDESRPALNGVYLVVRGGELRLVATDGHRLALARAAVGGDLELSGIVPRKAVQEMGRALGGAEGTALTIRERQFFLRTPGFVLSSKLVEGQFPNYEQVLPRGLPRRLGVAREPLMAALRRVSVLADDRTRPVRLTLGPGRLRLTASSQELGEAEEVLPAECAGEELAIVFNARYLLEALAPLESEQVVMELRDPLSAAVVRGATEEGSLCVIMPMRI